MDNKTVWVTGAHGFLGRNLCRYLSGHDFRVIGIGHGHWNPGEAKAWGISQWVFSDVTLAALSEIESKLGWPEAIFHTAGSGSVSMSMENPYLDYQRTVGTTIDVLEFARLLSPESKIIYPSSAAVYGAVDEEKISEDTPLNPVSPYGVHKEIAEQLHRSYSTHFGIRASIIRFFSLYGNGLKKQLLWDLCCKFQTENEEIILHGTGEEVRDWIHIEDAVRLMLRAYENSSQETTHLNGGTGFGTTVREIANEIRAVFGDDRMVRFNGMTRTGDPRFYQADISRAQLIGWKPRTDWRTGVKNYVTWFKETSAIS